MKDLWSGFLNDPCEATYRLLRAAYVSCDSYEPYSGDVGEVESCLERGELDRAERRLVALLSRAFLTPRVHILASMVARQRGDARRADHELRVYQACVCGILGTGDGTDRRPYLVTRVEDEYDVLSHFAKEPRSQALVREEERRLDFIECTDGTAIWFDVTDVFARVPPVPALN